MEVGSFAALKSYLPILVHLFIFALWLHHSCVSVSVNSCLLLAVFVQLRFFFRIDQWAIAHWASCRNCNTYS